MTVSQKVWKKVKLKDIVHFKNKKRIPLKKSVREKMEKKYPYYGASGIIDYVDDYIFDEELILLGEDGANILNRTTPLCYIAKGKYWVNNHAHVMKPKLGVDTVYLSEYLENLDYRKYNTGTAQPKLNLKIVKSIEVLLPPIEEQQKIASILSTWDEAIELYTRLLNEYQSKKEGLIEKILSSNLVSNPNWQKVKLSDVLIESKKVSDKNNQYPILTSAASGIYLQSDYFNKQVASSNNKGYKVIQKGQFTYRSMSDTGDFKFNQLLEYENGIVSPAYSVFEVSETINARFMYYAMNSPRFIYELKKVSQGGTRVALRFNQLKKLRIRIPSRKEQDQIAALFDTISDIEVKYLELIEGLKEQKRGLMQLLLTGKVRV